MKVKNNLRQLNEIEIIKELLKEKSIITETEIEQKRELKFKLPKSKI